jgi:hypothetical protein
VQSSSGIGDGAPAAGGGRLQRGVDDGLDADSVAEVRTRRALRADGISEPAAPGSALSGSSRGASSPRRMTASRPLGSAPEESIEAVTDPPRQWTAIAIALRAV